MCFGDPQVGKPQGSSSSPYMPAVTKMTVGVTKAKGKTLEFYAFCLISERQSRTWDL